MRTAGSFGMGFEAIAGTIELVQSHHRTVAARAKSSVIQARRFISIPPMCMQKVYFDKPSPTTSGSARSLAVWTYANPTD